jgi:DNA-binding NarL/FixJ family response regulator
MYPWTALSEHSYLREATALHARGSAGSRKRGTRLDAGQARAIAGAIAAGERHTAIAERYGVSVETVGAIKSGKRWAGAIDDDLRARMRAASGGTALDAGGAREVMAALEAGRPGTEIAAEFGISPSMVSAIKRGEAWSALDPELSSRLAQRPQRGKALTAEQVARIKRQLLEGKSSRKAAAEFGVSASTVRAIAQGKTWAGVAPDGAVDDPAEDPAG